MPQSPGDSSSPLIADFLADRRAGGARPVTVDAYAKRLRRLESATGVPAHLTTHSQLQTAVSAYENPHTAANLLRHVRPFARWLQAEGEREDDFSAGVRAPKPPDTPRTTPSDPDVDALRRSAATDPRDLAMIELLACTGARRSEIGLLTLADATEHLSDGLLRLSHSKTRPRLVPLSPAAEKALRRWLRARQRRRLASASASANLWLVEDGADLVNRVVQRHARAAGVAVTPHGLRRRFAVAWLRAGGSESGLMRLCGWSDGTMVRLYTAASASELALLEAARLDLAL